MTKKIQVLSGIITQSSCPLIRGLWPEFVAPSVGNSTLVPPSLCLCSRGAPPFTAVCGSGQVATSQDFKAVGRDYGFSGFGASSQKFP